MEQNQQPGTSNALIKQRNNYSKCNLVKKQGKNKAWATGFSGFLFLGKEVETTWQRYMEKG